MEGIWCDVYSVFDTIFSYFPSPFLTFSVHLHISFFSRQFIVPLPLPNILVFCIIYTPEHLACQVPKELRVVRCLVNTLFLVLCAMQTSLAFHYKNTTQVSSAAVFLIYFYLQQGWSGFSRVHIFWNLGTEYHSFFLKHNAHLKILI